MILRRISGESSALVFLHAYDTPEGHHTNEELSFARIPLVGEYVALSPESEWYRVYLVLHTPFEDSQFDAEVYAVKDRDYRDVLQEDRRMFEVRG